MALLKSWVFGLFLAFFLALPKVLIADQVKVEAIFFDPGNPSMSIGLIENNTLLEVGDYYEGYRVISFSPNSVVLHHTSTQNPIKWMVNEEDESEINEEAYRHGVSRFIVKQLDAIYRAQAMHLQTFRTYAEDLESLIQQGFLLDGFRDHVKMNYEFSITQTGKTQYRHLSSQRRLTFRAIAKPIDQKGYYFTVDELGEIRFAKDLDHLNWAPVWDYADHGAPGQRDLTVYRDYSLLATEVDF